MKIDTIGKIYKKQKESVFIEINKKDLLNVLNKLKLAGIHRIVSISGVDTGKKIDVVYHFNMEGKLINLKTSLSKKALFIKSITNIFPGATLFERELSEMLGVKIVGHPDMKLLFLDKKSPKTPLRKKVLRNA